MDGTASELFDSVLKDGQPAAAGVASGRGGPLG
jgi:hypothetical protein